MRVLNLVRLARRAEAARAGLDAVGCEVLERWFDPRPDDLLLTWNRHGNGGDHARHFEDCGARVLVMENGWLGKEWQGQEWVSICWGHHAGAGSWPVGDGSRWDSWSVPLQPWRYSGERVVLGQRSIGESGIASPAGWAERTKERFGGRIRPHPGVNPCKPIEEDLAKAGQVFTWNSGGALKALLMGIPVQYEFPQWIGAQAAQLIGGEDKRSDTDRLAMFRRLAWSMWSLDEIADGTAFRHLL